MDIDPLDTTESDDEESKESREKHRLNSWVAITVALLATFLGVCNIKDDNICQGMQQAQADKIDNWSFYQDRNIREEVAGAAAIQLRLQASGQAGARRMAYEAQAKKYEDLAREQRQKKRKIEDAATEDQKEYDRLNFHDDQFDLCNAFIAIAISMLAITSLTQKKWLYFLALAPSLAGALMGCAGLFGWSLHPDALTRLLS